MRDLERLKTAWERNREAMRRRPAVGRGTSKVAVRMAEGLLCEMRQGDWKVECDAPQEEGGAERAPTPGFFVLGGIGACSAMGLVMRAARQGLPIDGVTVEVEADYDSNGEYGLSDAPVGYGALRAIYHVDSPAPEEDIRKLLEEEERHGFMHDVIQRAITVSCQLRVAATTRS